MDREPGSFTFHNGVGIHAPTGTAVYPVVSGRATSKRRRGQRHDRDGRAFQYFHITPASHQASR